MKPLKSGCGVNGRALNSGWNWHPTKNGCIFLGNSTISVKVPSGERPERTSPASRRSGIMAG